MGRKKWDTERACTLFEEGRSDTEIAADVGVARATVARWREINGLSRKPRRCRLFHCDKRGDRYCCADCPEKKRDCCRNPCLNDPSRCNQEDVPAKEGTS